MKLRIKSHGWLSIIIVREFDMRLIILCLYKTKDMFFHVTLMSHQKKKNYWEKSELIFESNLIKESLDLQVSST